MDESWLNLIDNVGSDKPLENTLAIDITENVNKSFDELKKQPHMDLLEMQYSLCKYLKDTYKKSDMLQSLKIIDTMMKISKILCIAYKQRIIRHKMYQNSIPRSSYKFCNYEVNCNYYKKHMQCNSQHFVHNKVYADLDSLRIHLLNNCVPNNTELSEYVNVNEMDISLNTLMFVVDHMVNELKKL